MENSPAPKRMKLRLNIFDVIIIACAIIAAALIINYSSRSDSGASIIPAGSQETVIYTVELQGMRYGSADLIHVGDALSDNVERRALGTVVSVELEPAKMLQSSTATGDRVISEVPERIDAIITVRAQALVTESQISVDGFALRVGARASVNGPSYNGSGYISYIERSDAP